MKTYDSSSDDVSPPKIAKQNSASTGSSSASCASSFASSASSSASSSVASSSSKQSLRDRFSSSRGKSLAKLSGLEEKEEEQSLIGESTKNHSELESERKLIKSETNGDGGVN